MWFVCIGNTQKYHDIQLEALTGQLFLFSDKTQWKDFGRQELRDAKKKLEAFFDAKQSSLTKYYARDYELLSQHLQDYSSFSCAFTLLRNGDIKLEHNANAPRWSNAPKVSEGQDQEVFNHIVASQLFFFAKDICHRHQHHNPKTDTIVDLHPYSGSQLAWRSQTLFGLYKKIIQLKRVKTIRGLMLSTGILAYARAFANSSEKSLGRQSKQLPNYDNEALSISLKSAISAAEYFVQKRSNATNVVLTSIIGVLGVVFALVALLTLAKFKMAGEPHIILSTIALFLLHDPFQAIGSIIFSILTLLLWTGAIDVADLPLFRLAVRIFQAINRDFLGWTIIMLGTIILVGTWFAYNYI